VLTLARLLQQPELELTLLVDGPGVDRELLWLHNTELPDPSPYLRPGELVLTNGMWADETMAESFVAAVARADGAGIVHGLRDDAPTTPAALVDACRRAGLALAEISTAVPFTAVTRSAATILAEARLRDLTGAIRRSGALASAVSRGTGARGVLDVIRRDHDLPLAVVDRTGRELARAGAVLEPAHLLDVARNLAHHPPSLEVELGGTVASLFLVAAVGDVDAALVCLRPYRELSPAELDALQQACNYLSLEVAKQQAVHAIEQRFAGEVLDMVQAGPHREDDVAQRLRAFGVDPTGQVAVIAVAVAGSPADAVGDLTDVISSFLVDRGLAALVATGTRETVALFSWPPAQGRSLRTLAEELQRATSRRIGVGRVLVGIGGLSDGTAGLREILVQARETCRSLQQQRGGSLVQAFADLNNHRLLLGMLDDDARTRFSDGVLGAMRDHDRRRGSDLEATLRAYLELDGSYAETAARLHVHVNTLRQRLAKITELTGRDPRRTGDQVDLVLALEADALR
jgi:PucR family transcriptional regulator, purine catabolism regulatory protein